MGYIIVISALLLALVLATVLSSIKKHKNLSAWLISSFGKPPAAEDFDREDVNKYSFYMSTHSAHKAHVDDITWNDLEMDKVFERINVCLTSVGEEYLYNCLHELQPDPSILTARENFIDFLDKHPKERLLIQKCLFSVGKVNENNLSRLIFHKEKPLPAPMLYNVLAFVPLISLFILFISVPLGVACLIASSVVNILIYFGTQIKTQIDLDLPAIKYFSSILHCCEKLCKTESLKRPHAMNVLSENYHTFKTLINKIPIGARDMSFGDDISKFFLEFSNTVFLRSIRLYNKYIAEITQKSNEFHALYMALGEIDLSLCVLSFRKSLPYFSTPEFHEENKLHFEDIYHVLIPSPVGNTGTIKNDSVITGSNASGKSTFIKALAINGILAQTIFTCTGKRFSTRFSPIVTSMAVRDNLSSGDSYFIVEIKSIKRILDLMEHSPCMCYIDEILRGTNTIERIAASGSLLKYIHKQNCLCVVASHDIELTAMLANEYDNYHFSEHITEEGILFDYTLKLGPSAARNAIRLLDYMKFNTEIIKEAEELAAEYEKNKTWFHPVSQR